MVMTFAELVGLPARGECCVLLVPAGETGASSGVEAVLPRTAVTLRPAAGSRPGTVKLELLRRLRTPVRHILVDAASLTPGNAGGLFCALADTLGRRKVRSWWFLPEELLDHRSAAEVKARAGFVAVLRDGMIHFIHAGRVRRPEFFLPRPIVASPDATPLRTLSPFESLVTDIPAPLAVFDPRGTPLLANAESAREFGLDLQTLSQRPLLSLVAKDSVRPLLKMLSCLRVHDGTEARLTLLDRQRRRRPVRMKVRRMEDGRIVCLAAGTDDEEARRALEGSAEIWQSVMEHGSAVQALFRGVKLFQASRRFAEVIDWLGPQGEFDMNSLLGKRGVELRRTLAETGNATADVQLVNREGEVRHFELAAATAGSGRHLLTHMTLVDVTGREKVLRKLEESEALAREIAAATAAGLIVVRDGKCLSTNRAALEMLGFGTSAEVVNREFTELCGTRYREQVRQSLTPGAPESDLEVRLVQKNGGTLAVDLRIRPLATGHACLLHDVTPVRKLKGDLRRAHQQQDILEPFVRGIAGSLDPGQIASTALESLRRDLKFGGGALLLFRGDLCTMAASYGLPEKVSQVLASQVPGEGVPAYLAKTLEPVVTTVAEYPAHLPLKPLWEAEGTGTVVFAPLSNAGTMHGLLILLGTERELDEDWPWLFGSISVLLGEALAVAFRFAELKEEEERYRTMVEGLPDIAYRCRPNGAVEVLSPRMEQIFGHRIAEFQRDPEFWRTTVHPDDRAVYSRRVAGVFGGTDGQEVFFRMLPRGKAVYRWVRDTVRYERDAGGTVTAIVGILTVLPGAPAQAVTGEPDAAGSSKGSATAAAQEDEFASIVSHDLKESLITIEAYSKIVREEADLQPEMTEHLDRVVAASGRLKNLIDDLATLSRVGKDAGAHQTFPLHRVFAELVEEFEPTLRLRNARLIVPAEAPVVAYDRTQLTMVLRNLVSNGLKFNRNPEPAVEITVQEVEGEVAVSVRDNGIGIAPEDREKVFVIFRRLHPSSEFPGTGAGLAIVKRIVERHGGRILVESGEGSTFTFTIPSRRSTS